MSKYASYDNVKTRHANTALVSLTVEGNTSVVAEIAGLTVRESGGTDGTYTTGSAEPHEHVHNRYSCNVSCNRFVWKETAFNQFNIGVTGLLELPPFDITAVDEIDGAPLFTVIGATLADRSTALQANQRVMADMSLLALRTQSDASARSAVSNASTLATFLDDSQEPDDLMMAFMDLGGEGDLGPVLG